MIYDFALAMAPPNKPTTDVWYNKLTIHLYGSSFPFKVGDSVILKSDKYNGTHTIGYIYKGIHATRGSYWSLYFQDVSFTGTTSGTVELAETIEEKIAATAIDSNTVSKAVEPTTPVVIATTDKAVSIIDPVIEPVKTIVTDAASAVTDTAKSTVDTVAEKTGTSSKFWWWLLAALAIIALIYFTNKKQ